jgi:hypothetical protein
MVSWAEGDVGIMMEGRFHLEGMDVIWHWVRLVMHGIILG